MNTRITNNERQQGYTLGELMIAVGVLAILSAVAVPGMQNVVQNNRRVSMANEFVYALQSARSEAVTRNQRITVCASRNGTTCTNREGWGEGWIAFNNLDGNSQPDGAGEEIILHGAGGEGITVTPLRFRNLITYRPNGRVVGSNAAVTNGEFVLCDSRGADHARVLIVGTSGRPRISEKRANGNAPACG